MPSQQIRPSDPRQLFHRESYLWASLISSFPQPSELHSDPTPPQYESCKHRQEGVLLFRSLSFTLLGEGLNLGTPCAQGFVSISNLTLPDPTGAGDVPPPALALPPRVQRCSSFPGLPWKWVFCFWFTAPDSRHMAHMLPVKMWPTSVVTVTGPIAGTTYLHCSEGFDCLKSSLCLRVPSKLWFIHELFSNY